MDNDEDLYSRFDAYMEHTDKTVSLAAWIDNTRKLRGLKILNLNCRDCNREPIVATTGIHVCPECGTEIHQAFEGEYMKKSQAYKRMTHFRDWLTKTQARHNPSIPQDVMDICKQSEDKTYNGIKTVLKASKNTKYYEDIWFIISCVNPKQKTLSLSSTEESLLCNLFMKVQRAWETIKPHKRKIIISYPFIITELLDIINRPDLKVYFSLPRYNKVLEYKTQWRRIMNTQPFSHEYARG